MSFNQKIELKDFLNILAHFSLLNNIRSVFAQNNVKREKFCHKFTMFLFHIMNI